MFYALPSRQVYDIFCLICYYNNRSLSKLYGCIPTFGNHESQGGTNQLISKRFVAAATLGCRSVSVGCIMIYKVIKEVCFINKKG